KSRDTPANKCEFDKVIVPTSTQSADYEEIAALVTGVMDGYSVCLFAYGPTGSGKTHTMDGSDPNDPGVNLRALKSLFHIAEEKSQTMDFVFTMSVLEIYNESVRDLLTSGGSASSGAGEKEKLDVRLG